MPIALLLEETTAAFRYGGKILDPWNALVRIEELLIDRARSAFLIHWFGEHLPLHGFRVRVVLVNIDALRHRYEEAVRAIQPRAEGPNLTEPIMGMAGVLAGMLLTPGVAIGTGIAVARSLPWYLGALVVLLSTVAGVIVVALSPLLLAGSFVGYLQDALAGQPELRAIFDLLGAVALLLVAARKLIGLLLGPRSAVKNPVLLGMLTLADHLARAIPFALALVAVGVTRFGPILLPLAAQLGAFRELLTAAFDTIAFVLGDFIDQLKAALTGPRSFFAVLKYVLERLTRPLPRIVKTLTEFFTSAANVLTAWWKGVNAQVKGFWKGIGKTLKGILAKHPVAVWAQLLKGGMGLAKKLMSKAGPATPPGASDPTPFDPWIENVKKWGDAAGKVIDSFPVLPELEGPGDFVDRLGLKGKYGLPKDMAVFRKWIQEGLPPVSDAVTKYVERARHPTSAFALERKALEAQLGKKPADALAEAHARQLELRGLIETVVGRVLPPDLRGLMIPLVDAFEGLDQGLSLDPAKPKKKKKLAKGALEELKFPVKDLPPDNGRLRPVVQRLVLHARGGQKPDLQAFLGRLQTRLDRPYPAPA